jgi:hypothetical protein
MDSHCLHLLMPRTQEVAVANKMTMENEAGQWVTKEENGSTVFLKIESAVIVPTFQPWKGSKNRWQAHHRHSPIPIQSKAVDSTCSEDKRAKAASQQLSVDQASYQFKSTVKTLVVSRRNISLASGK